MKHWIVQTTAAALLASSLCSSEPAPVAIGARTDVQMFLGTYCTECHGAEKQKGERRFDQLTLPARTSETLLDLQDIVTQLSEGEMPPEKAKRHPDKKQVQEIVERLNQFVAEGQTRLANTSGRTVLRRLNRREYLNTVGDLFGLNMLMFDPTTKFPSDQVVMQMDNNGEALRTSGYLLDQYLEAAELVVEKAFSTPERPPVQTWVFNGNFHQQEQLDRHQAEMPHPFRYLTLYETPRSFKHNGAYGPLLDFVHGVPADGTYEIKVQVEALNRKHAFDPALFPTMDPAEPFRLGIVPGHEKEGWLHYPQPIEPRLAETTLGENGPEWHTFKVWLDAGYTPRFTFPNGMLNLAVILNQSARRNLLPEISEKGRQGRTAVLRFLPQIRIHEVRIRGPLYDEWPRAGQHVILGDKPYEPSRTREILATFASRAYRRPARGEEIDRLVAIVEQRRADGRTPFEAFKDGLKAVLCSPEFLFLVEPAPAAAPAVSGDKRLPAHALAARLSYFLWSTMPDASLSALAQSGELLKPEVLRGQAQRLLASARSDAFVEGFLDGWLNLRTLGDMPPAEGSVFDHYYAHDLPTAMRRETQMFARHLIEHNESILHFLHSDYTFVNRPLAKLYSMSDAVGPVSGEVFRKVKLTDPKRGGLLGQASVLTVSANGVETSPVTRGIWLLENILGATVPPPPDDVPPIDPDVRGAKSIREILVKHRENASCFECHRKIDPLGFALENFDPVGAWRSHYEKLEQVNPRKVNRVVGARIDPAGELPGGRSFEDLAGLKKILLERKDQFARTLTERLLAYACGRKMDALDRPEVNRIVQELAGRGYGFKDLIELVILSSAFQSK
jgi:hypothetical protein